MLGEVPLVTFEESLKSLQGIVPNLDEIEARCTMFANDLRFSNKLTNGITVDEAAAINLYTTETSSEKRHNFYFLLNESLRDPNRVGVQAFLPYMRLLFNALGKLEPYVSDRQLYRTIRGSFAYKSNQTVRWWAFSSSSPSLNKLSHFAGALPSVEVVDPNIPQPIESKQESFPALFSFKCSRAFDISGFSIYPDEKEILIVPPVQFKVRSIGVISNVKIIDLEEDPAFNQKVYYFKLPNLEQRMKQLSLDSEALRNEREESVKQKIQFESELASLKKNYEEKTMKIEYENAWQKGKYDSDLAELKRNCEDKTIENVRQKILYDNEIAKLKKQYEYRALEHVKQIEENDKQTAKLNAEILKFQKIGLAFFILMASLIVFSVWSLLSNH
jgi:hypothetical protein